MGERVLIKRKDPTQVSRGGIHIPQVATRRLNQGTVLKTTSPLISKGSEVLYSPFAGIPVHIGEVEMVVIDTADVLIILPDSKE